jgi:hypothetical protein
MNTHRMALLLAALALSCAPAFSQVPSDAEIRKILRTVWVRKTMAPTSWWELSTGMAGASYLTEALPRIVSAN